MGKHEIQPNNIELPPVAKILNEHGIPHQVFVHPGPVLSLEQAAAERNQEPGQVVRSLLFRIAADSFVMVLIAGPAQVPWKALRRYLGQSRVTMAKKEEVFAETGYVIGTVSPIGTPKPIRLLIDRTVTSQRELSIGSGRRSTTIIIQTADLLALFPEAEQVDLIEQSQDAF